MGLWVDWDMGLKEVMVNYYTDLFTESNMHWARVTECIPQGISDDHNSKLLAPIEEKEVPKAVFQMYPDKSPGLDGFNLGFYK